MDTSSISFGEIFTVDDSDYVFLGGTLDTTYAVKILTDGETASLTRIVTSRVKQGYDVSKNPLLCHIIIISTQQFKDRAVYLGKESAAPRTHNISNVLSDADYNELRKEILEGPVSAELKEIITKTTAPREVQT